MASSDDEGDSVLQTVTGYYFVDELELPISFSALPIQFDDAESTTAFKSRVFLHGTADSGLQKVYRQVTAWKLRLEDEQPEVSVLSKENNWIRLLKPRKSYQDCMRTIFITIQMLHHLKKNPEASEKSLWDYLYKVFSTFEDRPSGDDIRCHLSLVKLFSERDETLAKSQLLHLFLDEKFGRRPTYIEDGRKDPDVKQSFIVEDYEIEENDEDNDDGDESDEDSDLFDSVCALCDNGGELLCCEGRCMRSFHATKDAGVDSHCRSLGYNRAQVEAIQNFLCKNCKHRQHQCFACGKLGSSDKAAGAEVFKCVAATCGHFYHPKCVAGILFRGKELEATEYQKKIEAGESFTCPVHKCYVCKQGENKEVTELQFAMCRRCPKSYHRKCLPREIAFEDIEEEGIIQRAWDGLLPRRILIYCLKHEIEVDIGTPIRDHIIFPDFLEKEKIVDVRKSTNKVLEKRKRESSDGLARDRSSARPLMTKRLSTADDSHSLEKVGSRQKFDPPKKVKLMKDSGQSDTRKADEHPALENKKVPFKDKAKAPGSVASAPSTLNIPLTVVPSVTDETEKRVSVLKEQASSSITLERIIKERTLPTLYTYSARHIDKTITHGKIEGSVEAIQTALQQIEDGGSIEDVKAVCGPEMLKQIIKWNSKLRIYLAPFLHGMCYSSFGRHFTKMDKLVEIVDTLEWYVQEGDTIVDFCCGANDFSQLMKDKLAAVGKKCSFKNYDLFQPKNDFSFEKRDWFSVQPKELPVGSRLIMGLNPPFGVKAALANKFVDKALTFKPKLIILIVPKETERLDMEKKKLRYDLLWEDEKKLSGKSFYLPGSVDVYEKQIDQWNVKPPVLYLWSRPDWTAKHKAIALKNGHIFAQQNGSSTVETPIKSTADAPAEKQDMDVENEIRRESHKRAEHSLTRKVAEENEVRQDGKKVDSTNERRSQGENLMRKGGNETYNNKKKKFPENQKKSRKRRREKHQIEGSSGKKVDESSDMSISPPHRGVSTNSYEGGRTSELLDTPFQRASNHNAYSGARMEFGSEFLGRRSTTVYDNDVTGVTDKYTFNSGRHNLPGGGHENLDYGVRRSEEWLPDYRRDGSTDAYGRNPYNHDYDGYGRSEDDIRARIRLYGSATNGQDDFAHGNRYLLREPDSAHGQSGMFSSSTYGLSSPLIGLSAMQRYAPRLEETNYPRPGVSPHVARAFSAGASHDLYDIHGMRRDNPPPPDPMGFAPGPRHPYPHQGSSGWLDD